ATPGHRTAWEVAGARATLSCASDARRSRRSSDHCRLRAHHERHANVCGWSLTEDERSVCDESLLSGVHTSHDPRRAAMHITDIRPPIRGAMRWWFAMRIGRNVVC